MGESAQVPRRTKNLPLEASVSSESRGDSVIKHPDRRFKPDAENFLGGNKQ